MYLKALDMVGFKSFADKTHLDFEPGMTAIVGPNGCGKSNISDSLKWVLGEQSAKALRGSKMEDVIFSGTDSRKPLGMAEVSVTFAECEGVLNAEYNEVTITRRVYRSGESQYLINKTPCRLKDIHRLFMDTGVGTSSYSMMEQGRIDAILSARPEDRRAVFEEASGITKFKSDKKEAIRKLEQTEANLLRLSDVIREVKRQIGSLQRQAGKARRYKALQEELRKIDIFVSRQRLDTSAREIADIEARFATLTEQQEALQREIKEIDKAGSAQREALMATEREIGSVLEAGVQARSRLDHTRELIAMNRQRITEYRTLSERDTVEIDQTGRQLDEQRRALNTQTEHIAQARTEQSQAESEWRTAAASLAQHREQVERLRSSIQALREESVETESQASRLQNQIIELDAQERSSIIQRERYSAEKSQLTRIVEAFGVRQGGIQQEAEGLRERVAADESRLVALEAQYATEQQSLQRAQAESARLDREAAGLEARIDLLHEGEAGDDGFSAGARYLLRDETDAGFDRRQVVGALAEAIDVEPTYRIAIEAALRAWMDAVIIRDAGAARAIAEHLASGAHGSARLLTLGSPDRPAREIPNGDRLLSHINCDTDLQAALEKLIGHVVVVEKLADIPHPVPPHAVYVTQGGILVGGDGRIEVWLPEGEATTPIARHRVLTVSREELVGVQARSAASREQLSALSQALAEIAKQIQAQRIQRDESRRAQAQKDGELQTVAREAREAAQRLETVTWELDELARQDQSGTQERRELSQQLEKLQERRRQLTADVSEHTQTLRQREDEQADLQTQVTDLRIRHEGLHQRVVHLGAQHDSTANRIRDLESAMAGRTRGVQEYAESMRKLEEAVGVAEAQIAPMTAAVEENLGRAGGLQAHRQTHTAEIHATDELLANKRAILDEVRETRSETEIHLTESRMRRQNHVERVTSDYGLTLDQLGNEPAPEWPDGAPALEVLDTEVAELNTKIDAMGPVNLVAIEEYQELEERHGFLTAQETDLVNAKQQLMDMIRHINRTTSEMFSTTFQRVNEHFQATFTKLFN
ncbi:MAG: chromosome segregation protein SMC, partial [Verrucomicrobia bacterium]|nr:chromosome segregation protein SMC [Verrucomicrobiota bacterium]